MAISHTGDFLAWIAFGKMAIHFSRHSHHPLKFWRRVGVAGSILAIQCFLMDYACIFHGPQTSKEKAQHNQNIRTRERKNRYGVISDARNEQQVFPQAHASFPFTFRYVSYHRYICTYMERNGLGHWYLADTARDMPLQTYHSSLEK